MQPINVLSLCDGMSCGQIALKELGIEVNEYYASEIDKNAIKVTQDNFPETKQLGDIREITDERISEIGKIDLVMCGFPCRDLSICTRQGGSQNWIEMHKKGEGLKGEHSGLYHEFLRIYRRVKEINSDVKFLVENVASMKDEERKQISDDLGVEGLEIDSALFSAQERKRIYWTNIKIRELPETNIDTIKDILDQDVAESYFEKRQLEMEDENKRIVGRLVFDFHAHDIAKRVYNINYKAPTLTSCRGGNLQKKIYINGRCRKLTEKEYMKLQTIPEWYLMDTAKSNIYNMCGDGWTVKLIMHILAGLLDTEDEMQGKAQDKAKNTTVEEIKREYIQRFTTYIHRPGAIDLLEWMDWQGFFESPASTKYHGAEPGGLAQHSINVFKRLVVIAADPVKPPPMETLAIVALLHDLCKIDAYKENPEGSDRRYDITKHFPAGHGEKSVILIMRFMQLTDEEILAIRWHMGPYDPYAKGGGYDFENAFKQCKLAVMLHIADMMATHFDESEVCNSEKK